MAGDGAYGEVGAAIDDQLGDFRVHPFEMGPGMEDRGLTADATGIDVGAGVNVGAAVEEEAGRIEEAVFRGDVEESCAPEYEQAAARATAVELGIAAVEKRRVGIEGRRARLCDHGGSGAHPERRSASGRQRPAASRYTR